VFNKAAVGSAAGVRLTGTRAKATALLAVLQLTVVASSAPQSRGLDTLVPAQPVGYVNDFAGILEPGSVTELEALLRRLQSATGAEVAVVTLPSIGDQSEADVARAIGRRWRIGAKTEIGDPRRNAGAVVLIVPRQNHQPGTGHVRIETGQGLEGIVTDAAAGQIRRDVMGPDLQREAYGAAVTKGVRALTSLIARGYGVSDSTLTAAQPLSGQEGHSSPVGNILPILLFILFILIASGALGGGRRRRRGVYWGGPWIGGGGWGSGGGFGGGGGGFGGFGGGGGFSGGGAGGRF
jgi:uncharacterized protein